ncbi:MAG: TIGR01777 family oxidoreductase [Candidatus Eremiobacteraeota bacterium]|nr:TIGR01777 family oxidoreductase [Candidatus Eremiobacteraeota bacterium]
MNEFRHTSRLDFSPQQVYDWHLRAGAFPRLVPPWAPVRLLEGAPTIEEGSLRRLGLGPGPLQTHWVALHRDFEPGRQFVDEQLHGPFSSWVHTHRFEPEQDGCRLDDRIEYRFPLGLPLAPLFRPELERMFFYRHQRTRRDLERHQGVAPFKVAISGASGLIGSGLAAFLQGGSHEVLSLVRHQPANDHEVRWLPDTDTAALEGVEAVVHLAGESVAGLWTRARKSRILESRRQGTLTLCRALAQLKKPPRVLVCASAVGYYGHRGEQLLDETSPSGDGFLAEVCRHWEEATEPARAAGIRVVNLRIGVVLTPAGGALGAMFLPFWLGLGAVVGSGQQYLSWISHDDLIGLIHHALVNEELEGPVNAVGPEPVTQAEFASTLGRVLRRPVLARAPEWLLRLVLGEASAIVLESTRVLPRRAVASGFSFYSRDLESALRWELGRP